MTRSSNHRRLIAALLGGIALVLMPLSVEAASAKWIDEITALVQEHQEMVRFEARERAYDDYLAQLDTVRTAYKRDDGEGTYVAMNRLMDMLEHDPKGAGIPTWSAKAIFDFCGKVTPPQYHDAARHTPELSKGGFDYWADNVIDLGGGG